MSNLDESTIIKIFQEIMNNGSKFVSDDVESGITIGKTTMCANIDTLVQSTDIPPGMTLSQAAQKSVAACISDFAAKGIKPQFGMISVNLPKYVQQEQVVDIANGFKEAATEYGITITGGDTNSGKEITFSICIIGKEPKTQVRRGGAKKGDLVFVTGSFGYTAMGLQLLLTKNLHKYKKTLVEKAKKAILCPRPPLEFGIQCAKYFTSSMDSSDGLAVTLNEMSKQSKRKFVITNIPAPKDLMMHMKEHKDILYNLVFYGGEEYETVFTILPKYKDTIQKYAKRVGISLIEIGYVSGMGTRVTLDVENIQNTSKKKQEVFLKDHGWDHFM